MNSFLDLNMKARRARIQELARLFNAPDINLDGHALTDLWDLWAAAEYHPRITAKAFFPDKPKHYVVYTSWLGAYACNKAVAMQCRLDGKIPNAQCYETICEQIYNRLPEFLRW